MSVLRRVVYVVVCVLLAGPVSAQTAETWIQIEARPTEAAALERAGVYALRLPDVSGFLMSTGWYAIALGPYPEDEARARLSQLRAARVIPSDSYVTDGGRYGPRFFGLDIALTAPEAPAAPLAPGEETVAEARAAERFLTREERQEVQIALRAAGVYDAVIDADFGPGTRRAMGAWQAANGFEATGVLTTLQRRELVGTYRDALDALGFEDVTDPEVGIAITLPLGAVSLDRYEPPFAHYESDGEGGPRVLLISQTGDRATLSALYDILETLEIMPLDGPRSLNRADFTMTGENERISSHAYARVAEGTVKGYVLIWPADDGYRRRLALSAMEASFLPIDGVLPDTVGAPQDIDLLAGLSIRKPERSVSGFYVASDGAILTSASAIEGCARLEIGGEVGATVAASDPAADLALLRPEVAQRPIAVARLAAGEPLLQSDIAVAGYSFGGVLALPSVTFGTLSDLRGLDGDEGLHRLDLPAEPGDAGGPVFDASGAVAGLLLPQAGGARVLPGDVAFARDAAALAAFLSANGVTPATAVEGAPLDPEDLSLVAADITVLIDCWK